RPSLFSGPRRFARTAGEPMARVRARCDRPSCAELRAVRPLLTRRGINLENLAMRTLSFSSFLLASTLVTACATPSGSDTVPGDEELGSEDGDGEVAKADSQDNFDYLEVRKIGAFECNGVGSCTHLELNRANRTTTTCADNKTAATCTART